MGVQISTYRFTVEEFHRMGEAGIFKEDDRVELLDGEVIQMTPIGSRHAACVGRLTRILSDAVADSGIVWVQNPVALDDHSEPEPDVAIVRPRKDFYAQAHPGPQEVLLLIEVSDTTVEFDREVKLPLYAKAGIPEVWIVNLSDQKVEVYRQPSGQGYHARQDCGASEQIAPAAFPDLNIPVREILP